MRTPILIGMMGCGKSHVGRSYAARHHCGFVDTDAVIAKQAGITIAALFERDGEAAFRRAESVALKAVLTKDDDARRIIATGGGIVLEKLNRAMMRRHGLVVYLQCPLDELVRRLFYSKAKHTRPLLQGLDKTALKERLSALLAVREKWYQVAAHETIKQDADTDISAVVDGIDKLLATDTEKDPRQKADAP